MRLFIFIICLLGTTGIYAQHTITVKDTQNNLLPGANISYNNSGTTTDKAGNARIPAGLKKETPITVSFIGYESLTLPYRGQDMTFTLHEKEMLLEGITIVSQLPRATAKTPVSYKNISKSELAKRNLGQDIPMLLEGSPSVVTTSDAGAGIGYTNFRIRGTSTNRINVTINGVPMNDAESHSVFWVDVPDIASATQNIQIQRGVGTSSNGAASFGATLNLETDSFKKSPYAQVGLSGGSFNTFRQNYQAGTGLIGKHFTFDAKYSDIYSSGYIDRAFSDLKSYYAATAYHGENFLIKLLAFGGDEKTYQAWSGVPSSLIKQTYVINGKGKKYRTYNPEGEYKDENGRTQFYDNHTDNYRQNHYQLYYSHKLNDNWGINTTLHYTRGKGYYESYKSGKKYSKYNLPTPIGADGSPIKKTDLIQKKWLDNDFYGIVASAQYKKEAWDILIGGAANRYKGGHYGDVIWAKEGHFPHNYRWYNNDGTKDEVSTYVKANYQIAKSFNLFGDLQYRQIDYEMKGTHDDLRNISQSHDYHFFNPKVGITYLPNRNFRSYLSWGRAHREPSRTTLKEVTKGLKTPQAERLDDFELGAEYKTSTWRVSANLYYMLYKDQLIHTGAINNVGSAIMTNTEDSYRAGIELEAAIRFNDHIRWSGNATFSKNEAKDFTAYVDNWSTGKQKEEKIGTTTLAFSPKIIANSAFTLEPIDNFELTLLSKYVSRQYLDNTETKDRSIAAYFVNNIRVSYQIKPKKWFKNIAFNLQLNNISNTKYETNGWVYRYISDDKEGKYDGLFPQAGCYLMAGITFGF